MSADRAVPPATGYTEAWRVGRSIGRTIYEVGAEQPLAMAVGAEDEAREVADHIVALHNAALAAAGSPDEGLVEALEQIKKRSAHSVGRGLTQCYEIAESALARFSGEVFGRGETTEQGEER